MQGFVGHSLDIIKILIFTYMKVFNLCLQPEATPKECIELKILLGSTPKFQII